MPSIREPGAALRSLLADAGGRVTWQALERVADDPAFQTFLSGRYPSLGPARNGPGRRRMLQLMAASFALGGLAGCDSKQGADVIIPYVRQPVGLVPKQPLIYATATLLDGIANGALITTIDGRPIKVEGNPDHPFSRGGTDVFGQASVLGLYDPDRSQAVLQSGRISDWGTLRDATLPGFAELRQHGGRGLRLLTGPVTSPSLIAQIETLRNALPEMRWHSHAPVGRDALYAGATLAFGRAVETQIRFDRAEVIVSLDGDFLDPGPQQVGCAMGWSAARKQALAQGRLLGMHAAAAVPGLTFAKADWRTTVAQQDMPALAAAMLADLRGEAAAGPAEPWRRAAVAALKAAPGRSVVTAGAFQLAEVQAIVHVVNALLGNAGATVFYTDPVLAQAEPLDALLTDMHAGSVDTLLMLGCNPVYDSPAGAGMEEALARVKLKLHAGLYADETAALCDWHLPLAHPLESWGDARALDGTVSLLQPVIAPLYEGRSPQELLSMLTDASPRSGQDLLESYWQGSQGDTDFAPFWKQTLQAGFIANSAFKPLQGLQAKMPDLATPSPAGKLEVVIRPDPTVWDGSVSNNPWLQELPKPISKTTWENVITVSPSTLTRLGLTDGAMVELAAGKRSLAGPVWAVAGQNDTTVGLTLGYGRTRGGTVAGTSGYAARAIRAGATLWHVPHAALRRLGTGHTVAQSQMSDDSHGEAYLRVTQPGVGLSTRRAQQPWLYAPRQDNDGRAWGMSIDLDSCIGCNACVVACQAENNVPVVGRDEVIAGRIMHWLRIDRYSDASGTGTRFMPVPCMHCEQAPCEMGCPVEATLHDSEGLNLMVYNRCIGTRACSSYCPYKVRHFNYTDYTDSAPSIQAQRNPDVTVRARGVMEKCTYCVQRIVEARIASDRDHVPIPDDAVVTACAAACPTRAITFGDLAKPDSAVAAARRDPRSYALLDELGTRPRTTYLAAAAPAPGATG